MDHPLSTGPFPSPPLSPSDERDVEAFKHEGREGQPATAYDVGSLPYLANGGSSASDPLLLKSKMQTEEHITALRHRKQGKNKQRVADFYSGQNSQIESLLKSMDDHIQEAQEEEDSNRTAVSPATVVATASGDPGEPIRRPCADA